MTHHVRTENGEMVTERDVIVVGDVDGHATERPTVVGYEVLCGGNRPDLGSSFGLVER